jgi:hypothetical protein
LEQRSFYNCSYENKFSPSIIKNPCSIASNNFHKQKLWERERPRSHEKVTGIKLICKLLTNILLEMLQIIIDHKKQEDSGL